MVNTILPATTVNAPDQLSRRTSLIAADRTKRTPGSCAFGHQQVHNLLRRAVAEKLAQRLFVIGDAVQLDKADEIRGRVANQRRFGKMRIRGEKIVRPGVKVGEVRAASAGNENLLAGVLGALDDHNAASAAASFDRGHQTRRTRAEDEDIDTVRLHRLPLAERGGPRRGDRRCGGWKTR